MGAHRGKRDAEILLGRAARAYRHRVNPKRAADMFERRDVRFWHKATSCRAAVMSAFDPNWTFRGSLLWASGRMSRELPLADLMLP